MNGVLVNKTLGFSSLVETLESGSGEPTRLAEKNQTDNAVEAQACYDKAIDLMARFRNDEAAGYLKRASELGHLEARALLHSKNQSIPDVQRTRALENEKGSSYYCEFSGSTAEYFRIWIVNAFLTVITLGVYAAWAKVRTRRYFYANTKLDGESFDYMANPAAILKGHLIVAACFIVFLIGQRYNTIISVVAVGAFFAILPFLIYKSLRFFTHNSSYRNIRFRFTGSLGQSYVRYLLVPLVSPLTMGLIYPYWVFLRKHFFFGNLALGTTTSSFKGRAHKVQKIYVRAFFLSGCVGVIYKLFSSIMINVSAGLPDNPIVVLPGILFYYCGIFFLYSIVELFIRARLNNFFWNNTSLGSIGFISTLKAREMILIRVTNIIAIIISAGLLTPWAKIRKTRYILDNLRIIKDGDFNEFAAVNEPEETVLGDATTNFFDIEIGL